MSCETSHLRATNFRYDYNLNNNSLKHATDLTGDIHINTILGKANRVLAFLRHNSVMLFTKDHRILLYLTFVRSYIGYSREVWAPSISKNTGTGEMSYDTYSIFYIPVNFAFNLPNYVTSYMHYSGKKKKKKKICNLKVTKNLLPGDSNPDPPISKNWNPSIHFYFFEEKHLQRGIVSVQVLWLS